MSARSNNYKGITTSLRRKGGKCISRNIQGDTHKLAPPVQIKPEKIPVEVHVNTFWKAYFNTN